MAFRLGKHVIFLGSSGLKVQRERRSLHGIQPTFKKSKVLLDLYVINPSSFGMINAWLIRDSP